MESTLEIRGGNDKLIFTNLTSTTATTTIVAYNFMSMEYLIYIEENKNIFLYAQRLPRYLVASNEKMFYYFIIFDWRFDFIIQNTHLF